MYTINTNGLGVFMISLQKEGNYHKIVYFDVKMICKDTKRTDVTLNFNVDGHMPCG